MLEGEYADVRPAIRWVAGDLANRVGAARGELFFETCGKRPVQSRHGDLATLLHLLIEHCDRVQEAWLSYTPDHPYGLVVKVVAHCGHRTDKCERMCINFRVRPMARLVLTRIQGHEIAIGKGQKTTAA